MALLSTAAGFWLPRRPNCCGIDLFKLLVPKFFDLLAELYAYHWVIGVCLPTATFIFKMNDLSLSTQEIG